MGWITGVGLLRKSQWESREKSVKKCFNPRGKCAWGVFPQSFTMDFRKVFRLVFHKFSTSGENAKSRENNLRVIMVGGFLAIDLLLDFVNLIAQGEINPQVVFDFGNTMHDGGVILDANFAGDFGGTHV